MLACKMCTGMVVVMHICTFGVGAFGSVQHLAVDVPGGGVLRDAHATGASLFFGIYARSGVAPREMVWLTGVVLLLVMMGTAFIGYVLPWGQMSFWGATVMVWLDGLAGHGVL